ncbi:DUF4145 domain-containing protein [Actinomadura chokoriensis]|uniref:DUF4145 domain-containing protein n=1 Tax=Actinomadura chokoriensis TaxID=454156 RepID=UPI0031F86708
MWAYLTCVVAGAVGAAVVRWAWLRSSHAQRALNRTLRQKAVPTSLARELTEARACYNAKAFTATVVMVRRTLEAICADKGYSEKTLTLSLKKMAEEGELDPQICDWAHELRTLGNEGAHFTGNQLSRADASDALALARAMFEYQYVMTAQFEKLIERRKSSAPA